jgi:type IX secretion system PorP/SprF family membrane protein
MRKILIIGFTFILGLPACSQDLHFSQFYDMPLLRNPALSGNFTGQLQASTIYRNQWSNVTVPYQTEALGVEYKLRPSWCRDDSYDDADGKKPLTITIGLQVLRDQAGTSNYTRTMYAPSISFRKVVVNNIYVSTGFMVGRVTSSFNPNGLTWGDQYHNGNIGPTNQPLPTLGKNYYDEGVGVLVGSRDPNYVQWYLGGAMYHFIKATVGFGGDDVLPKRFTISGGLGLKLNPDDDLNRLFFYGDANIQANQYEYLAGVMYTRYFESSEVDNLYGKSNADVDNGISFGVFYRWNDAVVPTVRLAYNGWVLGFSYDLNISPLVTGSQTLGGPEVSAKFKLFPPCDGTGNSMRCPRGSL